jgi:hypothetical protein
MQKIKRGRGRPKGSKNKPKTVAVATPKLVEVVEKFADEDTVLPDDLRTEHATDYDVSDELSNLDGYQGFLEEMRGNELTFGDY